MEGKSGDSGSAEEAAPPSVAKLAGIFGDKLASPRTEAPPQKPARKKPPCSLPLPKPEATNNGSEKVSPPFPQAPKIKVKSSPLIEKLQANLAFAPAALLPGVSPKSPGLKVMASPFNSPPSTPSSPGMQSRTSESEESPVSFEQPPEGAPLLSYTKVRTRGSIKRRPPSRRFRKSQTDLDFDIDLVNVTPKENGDKAEEKDSGSVKGNKEMGDADPTPEGDAAPTGSSSESPPPADPGKTEKGGDSEDQKEETSPEKQGDNASTEEGTLHTHSSETKEEAVTGNTEETTGNGEHSEPEDKPEK